MITVNHLTKRYGNVVAVDGLSFEVGPGRVTGFLGPNGAGKTTTLRMLLGLAAPDGGTATIDGLRYRDLPDPARRVGAALDSNCFHPGRNAQEHLRVMAAAASADKGLRQPLVSRRGHLTSRRRRDTNPHNAPKTLAMIVAGAVISGLTFGLGLATIVLELSAHGFHHLPPGTGRLFADTVIAATLFGVIGVALGFITRSTVAAVVGAVGWVLFVELAILHTLAPQLAKWLITGAAVPLTDPTAQGPGTLAPLAAVAVLSVYALLLLGVATKLILRRDVA